MHGKVQPSVAVSCCAVETEPQNFFASWFHLGRGGGEKGVEKAARGSPQALKYVRSDELYVGALRGSG
jgi:hypothetical protein